MRQRCTRRRRFEHRSLWRSSGVENATPSNRMWAHAVVLNEIGIRTGQPMHVPSRLSGTDSACGPLCTCLPLLARTQAAPVPSAGGVNVLSTPRRPWRRRRRSSQLVSSSASASASTDPHPQIRRFRICFHRSILTTRESDARLLEHRNGHAGATRDELLGETVVEGERERGKGCEECAARHDALHQSCGSLLL